MPGSSQKAFLITNLIPNPHTAQCKIWKRTGIASFSLVLYYLASFGRQNRCLTVFHKSWERKAVPTPPRAAMGFHFTVSDIPQPAWLRQTKKTSALAQNSTGSDCDFTQPLPQNVDNLPKGWNKVSTRFDAHSWCLRLFLHCKDISWAELSWSGDVYKTALRYPL